jgi:hypothetical protein
MQKSLTLQPRQPLPGILNHGNTGIGVFPEVEEFLAMRDGPNLWGIIHCIAFFTPQ